MVDYAKPEQKIAQTAKQSQEKKRNAVKTTKTNIFLNFYMELDQAIFALFIIPMWVFFLMIAAELIFF